MSHSVAQPEVAAFARQPDFDANYYLRRGPTLMRGKEPVTVRARFSPYQARWIRERQYHASQQLQEHPDGGVIVTLRVGGTEQARRWLPGFGSEVEVLEPASLRAEIREELKKMQNTWEEEAQ